METSAVLVDTGPLVAFYCADDADHVACDVAMKRLPVGKAYTCWPVVAEASYMLRQQPQQRDHFLETVASGVLSMLHIGVNELGAIRDIFKRYNDQDIALADACLLYLADREDISTVLTLDRRHFGVLRRRSGDVLNILPAQV